MIGRTPLIPLAFAAIYLIWGSTYLAIRIGIETLPPFLMAGIRFLLAGLPFYAWLRWRGKPAPTRRHWASATLLGALMMFGGNGLVTWGEQFIPSSIAAVLIATVPLWMALLDRVFFGGGRLRPFMAVGLVLGFAGVAILMSPTGPEVERISLLGAGTMVMASFFWAIGSLHSRRAELPESPLMAVAMQMIGGGLILVVVGSITGEWGRFDAAAVSTESLLAMLYLIVFGSIVALSAYVWLLRVSTASAVSTYAFVNPVIAVILGGAFAGEKLGPRALLATSLILVAVAIILVARRRSCGMAAHEAAELEQLERYLSEQPITEGSAREFHEAEPTA